MQKSLQPPEGPPPDPPLHGYSIAILGFASPQKNITAKAADALQWILEQEGVPRMLHHRMILKYHGILIVHLYYELK